MSRRSCKSLFLFVAALLLSGCGGSSDGDASPEDGPSSIQENINHNSDNIDGLWVAVERTLVVNGNESTIPYESNTQYLDFSNTTQDGFWSLGYFPSEFSNNDSCLEQRGPFRLTFVGDNQIETMNGEVREYSLDGESLILGGDWLGAGVDSVTVRMQLVSDRTAFDLRPCEPDGSAQITIAPTGGGDSMESVSNDPFNVEGLWELFEFSSTFNVDGTSVVSATPPGESYLYYTEQTSTELTVTSFDLDSDENCYRQQETATASISIENNAVVVAGDDLNDAGTISVVGGNLVITFELEERPNWVNKLIYRKVVEISASDLAVCE